MRKLSRKVTAGLLLLIAFLTISAVWGTTVTTAQTTAPQTCAQLLPNVQDHLSAGCKSIDKDEVCYGNKSIAVEYTDSASGQTTFAKEGDIAPLNTIKSLTAGPLNPDKGEWGVAVVKTQPNNLEGTGAGQVVTFIVYGDTTITGKTVPVGKTADQVANTVTSCNVTTTRATYLRASASPSAQQVQLLPADTSVKVTGRRPDGQWVYGESGGKSGWVFVQSTKTDCDLGALPVNDPVIKSLPNVNAFYFSTAVGATSTCKDIPPAGMFVNSPKGIKVTFRLNGADVVMGSTAIFSEDPGPPAKIKVQVIEGQVELIIGGKTFIVNGGQSLTFPLGGPDGLQFIGTPGQLLPISADPIQVGYIDTLCKIAASEGLIIQNCFVQSPPKPQPISKPPLVQTEEVTTCSQRTFLSGGRVCVPNLGIFPCDRNGACDNPKIGETSWTCPEDCGEPPKYPNTGGGGAGPTQTPSCFYCGN